MATGGTYIAVYETTNDGREVDGWYVALRTDDGRTLQVHGAGPYESRVEADEDADFLNYSVEAIRVVSG